MGGSAFSRGAQKLCCFSYRKIRAVSWFGRLSSYAVVLQNVTIGGSLMKVVWGIYYFSKFSENLKIISKFESIFLKALIWAEVRNEWEIEDTGLAMNW